jgi:hypothetical protein
MIKHVIIRKNSGPGGRVPGIAVAARHLKRRNEFSGHRSCKSQPPPVLVMPMIVAMVINAAAQTASFVIH